MPCRRWELDFPLNQTIILKDCPHADNCLLHLSGHQTHSSGHVVEHSPAIRRTHSLRSGIDWHENGSLMGARRRSNEKRRLDHHMIKRDQDLELSEDVQRLLRAEEIFRAEVRRDLEKERGGGSDSTRFFERLNRPFTLWFLSSVILGLISFSYGMWTERRARSAENRAIVVKLDTEIDSRMRKSAHRLAVAAAPVGVRESITMLDQGTGIYPEFENRSMESLLWSLQELVPGVVEKQSVEQARAGYREWQRYKDPVLFEGRDLESLVTEIERDYFQGSFSIRRWAD